MVPTVMTSLGSELLHAWLPTRSSPSEVSQTIFARVPVHLAGSALRFVNNLTVQLVLLGTTEWHAPVKCGLPGV